MNNNTKYGLSSSIYTQNVNNAFQAMRDITTGIVYVNAGTIGAEIQLPFGGTRGTGNGHREAACRRWTSSPSGRPSYIDYSRPAAAGADRSHKARYLHAPLSRPPPIYWSTGNLAGI